MTTHFDHSIAEERLPVLLEALWWHHCRKYFPSRYRFAAFLHHRNFAMDELGGEWETIVITDPYDVCIGEAPSPILEPYDY